MRLEPACLLGDRSRGAACRSSSLRCIIGPSGLTSCIALSPISYEATIGGHRKPNVMGNVSTTQNRQLRSSKSEAGLHVRLLGPVRITIDGRSIAIASRKARALLSYLALREGTEVPRSVLIELLWGERSDGQARARSGPRQIGHCVYTGMLAALQDHWYRESHLPLTGRGSALDHFGHCRRCVWTAMLKVR